MGHGIQALNDSLSLSVSNREMYFGLSKPWHLIGPVSLHYSESLYECVFDLAKLQNADERG